MIKPGSKMTAADFESWMRRMGGLRGKERLSEREASELLGWSREPVRRVLAGADPPAYIAMACMWLEAEAAK